MQEAITITKEEAKTRIPAKPLQTTKTQVIPSLKIQDLSNIPNSIWQIPFLLSQQQPRLTSPPHNVAL